VQSDSKGGAPGPTLSKGRRAPIKGKAFATLSVVFAVLSVFMYANAGYGMEVQVIVHVEEMSHLLLTEGQPVRIWAVRDWDPNNHAIDDEASTTMDSSGLATATLTLTRPGEYWVFANALDDTQARIIQVDETDDGGTLQVWIELTAALWG